MTWPGRPGSRSPRSPGRCRARSGWPSRRANGSVRWHAGWGTAQPDRAGAAHRADRDAPPCCCPTSPTPTTSAWSGARRRRPGPPVPPSWSPTRRKVPSWRSPTWTAWSRPSTASSWCRAGPSEAELLALAERRPLVLFNRQVEGLPSVATDSADGSRQVVEHLVALGHRSIAYLAGPPAAWSDGQRWRALSDHAAAAGAEVVRCRPFPPTLDAGSAAAVVGLGAGATALVAFNDLLAIGVLRRLEERGVAVPEQVSVVGFDDISGPTSVPPTDHRGRSGGGRGPEAGRRAAGRRRPRAGGDPADVAQGACLDRSARAGHGGASVTGDRWVPSTEGPSLAGDRPTLVASAPLSGGFIAVSSSAWNRFRRSWGSRARKARPTANGTPSAPGPRSSTWPPRVRRRGDTAVPGSTRSPPRPAPRSG